MTIQKAKEILMSNIPFIHCVLYCNSFPDGIEAVIVLKDYTVQTYKVYNDGRFNLRGYNV